MVRTSLYSIKILLIATVASGNSEEYLLMRNSVLDTTMRIHVASFDTAEGHDYNAENCWIAASLFQNQEGVSVTYWCEPVDKDK